MKTDLSSAVATGEFSKFSGILSATLSQHHLLGFERAQLEYKIRREEFWVPEIEWCSFQQLILEGCV